MVENYGDSKLATRFGVTRYPAIFVDDVLVATPNDFGFYGNSKTQSGGRYAPLKSAASHDRFRADLSRMINLILAGRKDDARAQSPASSTPHIATMPALNVVGLDGKRVTSASLAGKVVLVEFWATWCPPCHPTLSWLGELKKRHGDRIAIVAVSVESEEADVRKLAGELEVPLLWTTGTPELARAFGDISAVPTLFVFDREGKTAGVFYGAPPTLHREAESMLARLAR